MQTEVSEFGEKIYLPDTWQRRALGCLRNGNDVVLHAPTGAGKTYVFEQLIESGWKGRAVYTVPTRALANDKFREWQNRGWEVGLITGDLRYRRDARIVVATLETQRSTIEGDEGPDLFVVDEYQMLGDLQRGPGYEVTLAMAANKVRLLLMSGSVSNPLEVADWLRSHGREVSLVTEGKRPVPLEEVFAEALLRRPFEGRKVRGHWPKLINAALRANLGPILVFAPRRRAAEDLARQLALELPSVEPLDLTVEQKKAAGKDLASLLKRRIAYHHSGLDYLKRAGIVEPLAKAGQLQVVVATTGLAAGINFSMRSVLVTDREYRMEDGIHFLRPDELLQMFGRAGRRGLDDRGFIIVAPKQARMSDARPLKLKRSSTLDWSALIGIMNRAATTGENHIESARWLANRLFTDHEVRLGFRDALSDFVKARQDLEFSIPEKLADSDDRDHIIEMRNSAGLWERRSGQLQTSLKKALALHRGEWVPALSLPDTLSKLPFGNPCRFGTKKSPTYGREMPLAVYDLKSDGTRVTLIKSFRKRLREITSQLDAHQSKKFKRKTWRRDGLEDVFGEILKKVSNGGRLESLVDRGKVLSARLRYEEASVLAWRDARGKMLLNPPLRKTTRVYESPFKSKLSMGITQNLENLTAAEIWYELGLIDKRAIPTLRGQIFSLFSRGEGLAIAVALENKDYSIDELILDLANLRAGHRFSPFAQSECRLSIVCREEFGLRDCPGYLRAGIPIEYGEGAVDLLRTENLLEKLYDHNMEVSPGDLERVKIEWKSLLSLIANGPTIGCERWSGLRDAARQFLGEKRTESRLPALPEIPSRQQGRYRLNN